jgi:hypothetical protein
LSGCGNSDNRKTNKLVRRKFTTKFKQTNIKNNNCTCIPSNRSSLLEHILKTTRFLPQKLDGKDTPGYLDQSSNLNLLERKLGASEKHAFLFISNLSLVIFSKALGFKYNFRSDLGKAINMPSTLFVA